jgi:hypothetical protein
LFIASGGVSIGIGAHCLVIFTVPSLVSSCNQSSLSIAIITISPSIHLHRLLIAVLIGVSNYLLCHPSPPQSSSFLSHAALFDYCVVCVVHAWVRQKVTPLTL